MRLGASSNSVIGRYILRTRESLAASRLAEDVQLEQALKAISDLIAKVADIREVQQLQAQIDTAFWAKWMFWATIGSMTLSGVAVVFAFLSWRTSKGVGEIQTQAYVYASSAKFGDSDNIVITCRNGGQTPAAHFYGQRYISNSPDWPCLGLHLFQE